MKYTFSIKRDNMWLLIKTCGNGLTKIFIKFFKKETELTNLKG